MARSPADLLALKDELTNDPAGLGLVAPPTIDDVGNAEKLSTVNESIQIDRTAIPTSEIYLNIDRDEYAALAQADRDWLNGVSQGGTIDPRSGGEVREGLLQIFSAQSETRANLLDILTEPATRIEQMFRDGLLEQGGIVSPSDVSDARNAT